MMVLGWYIKNILGYEDIKGSEKYEEKTGCFNQKQTMENGLIHFRALLPVLILAILILVIPQLGDQRLI